MKIVIWIGSALLAGSAAFAALAGPAGPAPQGTEDPTPTATDPLATETAVATETAEPDATPTVVPAVPTTEAPDIPGSNGGGRRDVVGIPDDNGNFAPTTDGTAIKTTPSGVDVNVPSHAAENSTHAFEGHPDHDHGPGGEGEE